MTWWNWLEQNAQTVSAIGTLLMVVIWVAYLQMFYASVRRHRRPRLVIQQSRALDVRAPFLIANMSSEPIFLVCAMAITQWEGGTDRRQLSPRSGSGTALADLRQGTLGSGESVALGPFEEVLGGIDPEALGSLETVEVRIVAVHGPSDQYVAAARRYRIGSYDNQYMLRPTEINTRQLRRRWHRATARRWARECLDLEVPPGR